MYQQDSLNYLATAPIQFHGGTLPALGIVARGPSPSQTEQAGAGPASVVPLDVRIIFIARCRANGSCRHCLRREDLPIEDSPGTPARERRSRMDDPTLD